MNVAEQTAVMDTPAVRRSESCAAAMLLVACMCWATFFTLCKDWLLAAQDCPAGPLVASLTLLGLRTVLALLVCSLIKPRLFLKLSRHDIAVGLLLGALTCLGNILQVWGLASTSPALSGFFTSLASLWVPILACVCFRLPITRATGVAILLGIGGLAILGIDPTAPAGISFGDGLTVLSSFAFAMFIVLLDRLGRSINSAHLTLLLIAVTGLPALILAVIVAGWHGALRAWLTWLAESSLRPAVIRDVLLMTALSTLLATYLMSTYQPRVPASRAALLYLLEPVFAALLSIAAGHDTANGRLLLGGALILSANALVEFRVWIRRMRGKQCA
jgi:drug/metabolite transporter (DMT)-like permease